MIVNNDDVDESLEDEESGTVRRETIVKGDRVHRDGLRVLLFATENSLRILARARTILGDGTFRICPSLWYQVFIISAELKGKVFVPVASRLLTRQEKKNL